jgi:hypothetical protein
MIVALATGVAQVELLAFDGLRTTGRASKTAGRTSAALRGRGIGAEPGDIRRRPGDLIRPESRAYVHAANNHTNDVMC